MKVGDQIPVTIAGQTVALAEVKELGDGSATLIVPGTRVVMATRTELSFESTPNDTSGVETIIDGVDRAQAPVEAPAVSEVATPVEQSAPVATEPVAPAADSVPTPVAESPTPAEPEAVTGTTEH